MHRSCCRSALGGHEQQHHPQSQQHLWQQLGERKIEYHYDKVKQKSLIIIIPWLFDKAVGSMAGAGRGAAVGAGVAGLSPFFCAHGKSAHDIYGLII